MTKGSQAAQGNLTVTVLRGALETSDYTMMDASREVSRSYAYDNTGASEPAYMPTITGTRISVGGTKQSTADGNYLIFDIDWPVGITNFFWEQSVCKCEYHGCYGGC